MFANIIALVFAVVAATVFGGDNSIHCSANYRGSLHLWYNNQSHPVFASTRGGWLTSADEGDATKVVFQKCHGGKIPGTYIDNVWYGKIVLDENNKKCVTQTADNSTARLSVDDCSSSNKKIVNKQMFQAAYSPDAGQVNVTVIGYNGHKHYPFGNRSGKRNTVSLDLQSDKNALLQLGDPKRA